MNGPLSEFFKVGLAADIELLELTPEIASATNDLPENFPGDPFDRVIAATAKVLNLTLITCDSAIRDARFCRVEFYPFKPSREAHAPRMYRLAPRQTKGKAPSPVGSTRDGARGRG